MQFTSDQAFAAASDRITTGVGSGMVESKDVMSHELMEKLNQKIHDSRLLTESALKVTKNYKWRSIGRKVPRFLGKAAYGLFTCSVVSAAIFKGGEVDQFDAIKDMLNYYDLIAEATKSFVGGGNFRDFLGEQWDKVLDNKAGYAEYGFYQLALAEAKGMWDKSFDHVLGAYSSGVIKLDDKTMIQSASVMAAYERLGVPLTIGGDARETEEIKKDISDLVDRVEFMDRGELAHFMRATGLIDGDSYQLALKQSIQEKAQIGKIDQVSSILALEMATMASENAYALINMFALDRTYRKRSLTVDKTGVINEVVFSKDEYNRVEELLKKAGVIDGGGDVNNNKKLKHSNPHSIMTEHILATLESGDAKTINEMRNVIRCLETALERAGIEKAGDAFAIQTGDHPSENSLRQRMVSKRIVEDVGTAAISGVLMTTSTIKSKLIALKESQTNKVNNRQRNGIS